MTDQDKQTTPAEALPGDTPSTAAVAGGKSKDKAKQPKPAKRAWIGYLVLLSIIGIAVGGYFLIQQIRSTQEGLGGELSKEDREIAELNSQVADLQGVFKTLHGQVATIETRIATEDNKLERSLSEHSAQFNAKLAQTQAELQADLQTLHRALGKTRSDWLVADAEYLLGAALQRLHLVGDVKTAVAALEGADERLRDSGDPGVFKVREQLAKEIRVLKEFTPPDLIGASSRLLVLEGRIPELALLLPHAGKPAGSPGGQAPVSSDAPLVDNVVNELEKYVAIRRLDKPVSAVLTPEEARVLREILLLKLETARMALVRGDETLYRNSLDSARAWLAEHFDQSQPAVRSVDGDLKSLMAQALQVPYPDIGKALAMLRDIAKLRLEAENAAPDKAHEKKAATPPAAETAPAEQGAPKP